jgi:polysaccharide biosynthesis transport protein
MNSADTAPSRDLSARHLLGIVRKRAWIIIAVAVVVTAFTYFLAARSSDIYQASTSVQVTGSSSADIFSTSGADSQTDSKAAIDTEIQLLQSNRIRTKVNQALGQRAAAIGQVTMSSIGDAHVVKIAVNSTSPEVARDAANAFAQVFVSSRRDQLVADLENQADKLNSKAVQLGTQIQDIENQIASHPEGADVPSLQAQQAGLVAQQQDFSQRASQLEVEASLRTSDVQQIDSPEVPTTPISPKPARDAALALALTLLLGVGIALVIDRIDDRITGPDDLTMATGGLPVLASVPIYSPDRKRGIRKLPHGPRKLVPLNSPDAEVYRTLRSNLRFSNLGKTKQIIMVTSPLGGEGKSTVTANLAVSLAEGGHRVVAISGDLRRPVLAGIFGVDETKVGLTSVLVGDRTLPSCLVPVGLPSGHEFFVLPSGPLPPNPAEILDSRAMGELLSKLSRSDVDFVLIDCPPVLPVSDPLAIAQFADGVIMVSVVGRTRAHSLTEACDRMHKVGADVLGVVLNGIPTVRGRYPYYYYSRRNQAGADYLAQPSEDTSLQSLFETPQSASPSGTGNQPRSD